MTVLGISKKSGGIEQQQALLLQVQEITRVTLPPYLPLLDL
jgi:hypothetical protein